MKIRVGDRVKFLSDTGEGEVMRIIDQKTALVSVDDGFEVPWMINDLVVSSGSYGGDDDIREVEKEENSKPFAEDTARQVSDQVIEDEEIGFAFLPLQDEAAFETYMINSSSYYLKYTISRMQEGEQVLFHEGTLEPGLKENLGSYHPSGISQEEFFRIQAVFFNLGFYVNIPPLDSILKIDSSQLFNGSLLTATGYFVEKANLFTLYSWKKQEQEEIKIDPSEIISAMYTKGDLKKPVKKEKPKGPEEIDLHIEELVDDHKSMSNSEILDVQTAKFKTALDSAQLHGQKKIVFIHGVGNGRLKMELRRIIDHDYSNARYQDASFKEYGFGATMVLFK